MSIICILTMSGVVEFCSENVRTLFKQARHMFSYLSIQIGYTAYKPSTESGGSAAYKCPRIRMCCFCYGCTDGYETITIECVLNVTATHPRHLGQS